MIAPPETFEIVVPDEPGRARLDHTLAHALPEISRSRLQALVRAGAVMCEGHVLLIPSARVDPGQTIIIVLPEPEQAEPLPETIPLDIVYEDKHLIVLDKPAGLVVHPAPGHYSGTLVNALLAHCGEELSGIGGVRRPGIVHRLDKDTSGLLVVAKNDTAHAGLSAQFADHGRSGPLERAYLAFVWGVPKSLKGTIDAPLERARHNREKIIVAASGRSAITHYIVEESYPLGAECPLVSCVRCTLETGRTHQIRVHLGHVGHPLLGDGLYGQGFKTKAHLLEAQSRDALTNLGRQALHAAVLGFSHPVTGETLRFESALPADLRYLREMLQASPL